MLSNKHLISSRTLFPVNLNLKFFGLVMVALSNLFEGGVYP